jgi:hypothetical protein
MSYPSAFVALSTTVLIVSSSHSPAPMVIMRAHLVGRNIYMRMIWCIRATRRCTGIRWRRFFFNGMSTCCGPVSARQNDRGTLNMSGLDRFLVLIQAHLPPHLCCMVRGNLQLITSYFPAILPDVLTPSKLKCNAALRAARMPIEKTIASKAAL